VVRLDGYGRRRYVDAELVSDEGVRVSVEVDGAAHMTAAQWWQDADRANELVIAGDRTLRFPSFLFYTQSERVADQIRRALHRR
jgi:very-short-patch-repair endonuclease